MRLINLFENSFNREKTRIGNRYEYWTDSDVEPDENIKLWHYIRDSETGNTYKPDWSPYSEMTPRDVEMYMWLVNNGGEPTRQEIDSIGPLDLNDLKKIAIDRRSSTREESNLTEVEHLADQKFPDTADGARAALSMMSGLSGKKIKQFVFFPDREVEGVWGADHPNGTRVIIYLAGYKTPLGEPRKYNDFEEGEWLGMVDDDNQEYKKRLLQKLKEPPVQSAWESVTEDYGSLSDEDLNEYLKQIITNEFKGQAWVAGGSYAYRINVHQPNMLVASDGSKIKVKDWATGLRDYLDKPFYNELKTTDPDYWRESGILLPVKSIRGQEDYETGKIKGDWYESSPPPFKDMLAAGFPDVDPGDTIQTRKMSMIGVVEKVQDEKGFGNPSVYFRVDDGRLMRTPLSNVRVLSKKKFQKPELKENLRKWFKEKWVRFGPDGKIRGACARGDDSEGKPKCLPQSKAYSLGKKGRASAATRKRREDPNPERTGKAINVATKKKTNKESLDELKCWPGYTRVKGVPAGKPGSCKKKTAESTCPHCGGEMVSEMQIAEKKDACYYKVKSRYKVWPSAYASGALVQCRKRGAKNWGSKS